MVGQLITRRIGPRVSRHIVRVHRPTLDLSFGLGGGFPPGLINFTRASPKWVFDGGGSLQEIGNDVWPQDYDPVTGAPLGMLIEEQRINGIRNNTMVNAVPGTPGTPPDNWTTNAAGATVELVDVGTINGIEYVSYRLSGTPTGGSEIHFETTTGIDALTGDVRTISAYMAIVAGDLQNLNGINFNLKERTEAGAFIKSNHASSFSASLASSLQRFDATITLSGGGTTAHVMPIIRFDWDGSGAIDITLRIGLPQEEKGAFASSVIKTTNAAVARAADMATISDINFLSPLANTWLVKGRTAFGNGVQVLGQIDDGDENERIRIERNASNEIHFIVTDGGVEQCDLNLGTVADDTDLSVAVAWAANDFAGSLDGAAVVKDAAGAVPAGLTTKRLGRDTAGNQWNRTIESDIHWPRRQPDSHLQRLAA